MQALVDADVDELELLVVDVLHNLSSNDVLALALENEALKGLVLSQLVLLRPLLFVLLDLDKAVCVADLSNAYFSLELGLFFLQIFFFFDLNVLNMFLKNLLHFLDVIVLFLDVFDDFLY